MDELIEIIEREFYSFDVPQLVAVIEELLEDGGGGVGGRIYFEVDADLSFPPSDVGYVGINGGCVNNDGYIDNVNGNNNVNNNNIDRISNDNRINNDNSGATVRLPVMNLLGSSSPLPIDFSDHITRGRPDADMYAGFLSIMQNRLHTLWLDACRKYSLWGGGGAVAEKIFESMTGLSIYKERATTGRPYKPEDRGYVDSDRGCVDVVGANCVRPPSPEIGAGFFENALTGLWHLSNRNRSAQGLKELLSSIWEDIPITIEENVGRWAAVSNARPLGGAARLGRNAAVGARIYDRTSKFRVTVGPLDRRTYGTFMPGESNYLLINGIVSIYLNEPVICELSVTCRLRDLPRARLGGPQPDGGGGEIGRTAVLGAGGGGGLAVYLKQLTPG